MMRAFVRALQDCKIARLHVDAFMQSPLPIFPSSPRLIFPSSHLLHLQALASLIYKIAPPSLFFHEWITWAGDTSLQADSML